METSLASIASSAARVADALDRRVAGKYDDGSDDPPMCGHGTQESQGWSAQCEAGVPEPAPSLLNDPQMRAIRQKMVADWVERAFGAKQRSDVQHRAIRLLEEVIELYQATGAPIHMAHQLIDYVFSRPVGDLAQELGGVGVTVLALAAAADLDADAEERREVARVLGIPVEHFSRRNDEKNAAGFKV